MAKNKTKTGKQSTPEQTELDLENLTLEKALERLEEIVVLMDSDTIELQRAIELFEEGMHLTKYCQEQITDAEQQIQKLVEGSEGEMTLKDYSND